VEYGLTVSTCGAGLAQRARSFLRKDDGGTWSISQWIESAKLDYSCLIKYFLGLALASACSLSENLREDKG